MKKFYSKNVKLIELLSEKINIICNKKMEMIINNDDAEHIEEIIKNIAPAAINDYSIEDITED